MFSYQMTLCSFSNTPFFSVRLPIAKIPPGQAVFCKWILTRFCSEILKYGSSQFAVTKLTLALKRILLGEY